MFTITDPELSSDELVARVREETRRRQQQGAVARPRTATVTPTSPPAPARWAGVQHAIGVAEGFAVVGETLPPMHTLAGWRRRLATPIAKAVLRLAALVTREQTSFNVETIKTLRLFAETVAFQHQALERNQTAVVEEMRGHVAALADDAARRQGEHEATVDALRRDIEGLRDALRAGDAALAATRGDLASLRTELVLQERRVAVLLEEARRGNAPDSATAARELEHLLDSFYVSFEDAFRGTREMVMDRVRTHLAAVRDAGAGTPERPVLDVACGRGEWLEVLRGEGLVARGVDTNRVLVADDRARGLDVVERDAYAYLRSLPDRSVGAVSALHFLEHLPFAAMVAVVDEILRVLQPGGVAIFETPNPQNLLVGASYFYVDPTHRNPIYPDTLAFLLEARGFVRVALRELHPADAATRFPEDGSPVTERLNRYFYGPHDFAAIGHRA